MNLEGSEQEEIQKLLKIDPKQRIGYNGLE